jgi:hypothetical protein
MFPLLRLAPPPASAVAGLAAIGKAVGFASIKAVVCMASIVLVGRTLLQPIYRRVAGECQRDPLHARTHKTAAGM